MFNYVKMKQERTKVVTKNEKAEENIASSLYKLLICICICNSL